MCKVILGTQYFFFPLVTSNTVLKNGGTPSSVFVPHTAVTAKSKEEVECGTCTRSSEIRMSSYPIGSPNSRLMPLVRQGALQILIFWRHLGNPSPWTSCDYWCYLSDIITQLTVVSSDGECVCMFVCACVCAQMNPPPFEESLRLPDEGAFPIHVSMELLLLEQTFKTAKPKGIANG